MRSYAVYLPQCWLLFVEPPARLQLPPSCLPLAPVPATGRPPHRRRALNSFSAAPIPHSGSPRRRGRCVSAARRSFSPDTTGGSSRCMVPTMTAPTTTRCSSASVCTGGICSPATVRSCFPTPPCHASPASTRAPIPTSAHSGPTMRERRIRGPRRPPRSTSSTSTVRTSRMSITST